MENSCVQDLDKIRETDNFFWFDSWLLGEGSFGKVYQGRHKETGATYAIKTTTVGHLAALEKEAYNLRGLCHENIIKLEAVEKELGSGQNVVVMEYCNGNSLHDIISHPENINGLNETDLLQVLHDLTAALEYLRSQDIVHRDLNPNNMVRCIKDDTNCVYKCVDFATARLLKEGDQFRTVCGTPGYMPAEALFIALYRSNSSPCFTNKYDLRLVGAMLFHLITGQLPFRPFIKNVLALMQLVNEKRHHDVIEIEQNRLNGHLICRKHLPETCHLNSMLRKLMEELLRNLLVENEKRRWDFPKFLSFVKEEILSRRALKIFHINEGKFVTFYAQPNASYSDMQDFIEQELKVQKDKQLLVFNNDLVINLINPRSDSLMFLQTSVDKPLLLLDMDKKAFLSPHLIKFGSNYKHFCEFKLWETKGIMQYFDTIFSKPFSEALKDQSPLCLILTDCLREPLEFDVGSINQLMQSMSKICSVVYGVKRCVEKLVYVPSHVCSMLQFTKRHIHELESKLRCRLQNAENQIDNIEKRVQRLKTSVLMLSKLKSIKNSPLPNLDSWVNVEYNPIDYAMDVILSIMEKVQREFSCCMSNLDHLKNASLNLSSVMINFDLNPDHFITSMETYADKMCNIMKKFDPLKYMKFSDAQKKFLTAEVKTFITLKENMQSLFMKLHEPCKKVYQEFEENYSTILDELYVYEDNNASVDSLQKSLNDLEKLVAEGECNTDDVINNFCSEGGGLESIEIRILKSLPHDAQNENSESTPVTEDSEWISFNQCRIM